MRVGCVAGANEGGRGQGLITRGDLGRAPAAPANENGGARALGERTQ